jgi:hypothetical protein
MALTGRRPAKIFFSASFGTSFEPYPIPVLGDPKKIVQALETLRSLKSFPSPKAVNTTTGPQLPKYVSAAFGSLDLQGNSGPEQGNGRSRRSHARAPTAAQTPG